MREIFVKELAGRAIKDKRITIVTGDLGFRVLDHFRAAVPDQFINAGLAETSMTGIAAGLAKEGKIVFTYSIGNFPTFRALEQLRIDVAYHEVNVTAVSIGGGWSYGQLGMTHHATEDLATMRAMPLMKVFSPGDDFEVAEITKCLARGVGPSFLRLDKDSAGKTKRKGEKFVLGNMRILRDGKDITFMATGGVLRETLTAADHLAASGVRPRAISVHSLKPIDSKTIIEAAKATGGIITVEEHVVEGGLGGAVSEVCVESGIIPKRFLRLGLRNEFASVVGSQTYLRSLYGLDANSLVKTAKKLIS